MIFTIILTIFFWFLGINVQPFSEDGDTNLLPVHTVNVAEFQAWAEKEEEVIDHIIDEEVTEEVISPTQGRREKRQFAQLITTLGAELLGGITSGQVSDFVGWIKGAFGPSTAAMVKHHGQDIDVVSKHEETFSLINTMLAGQMSRSEKKQEEYLSKLNETEEKEVSTLNKINEMGLIEMFLVGGVLLVLVASMMYLHCKYVS